MLHRFGGIGGAVSQLHDERRPIVPPNFALGLFDGLIMQRDSRVRLISGYDRTDIRVRLLSQEAEMTAVDIVLLREPNQGKLRFVAYRDFNLALEGPLDFAEEASFVAEYKRLSDALTDNAERPTPQHLRSFGRRLADALFPGDISRLVGVLDNDTLQLGICANDPALKSVPWEYLVCPGTADAPNIARTIARIVPVSNGANVPATKLDGRPLRVCMIVADPSDLGKVPWDDLKGTLESTFDSYLSEKGVATQVKMDLVEAPNRRKLNTALGKEDYDVIHFLGHGEPDALYLVDRANNNSVPVPADVVVPLFQRDSVKLIILTACSTGKQAPNGLPALAERLVSEFAPAVVGNQLPITSAAIACFCGSFYQQLLSNGNVDEAFARGRQALKVQMTVSATEAAIEWGIPILYRRPGRSVLFT